MKIIKKQIKDLEKIGYTDIIQKGLNSSGHPFFFAKNKHGEKIRLSGSKTPSDYRGYKNFLSVAKKKYNGTYVPRYINR